MNLSGIREDITDLLSGVDANVYFFPPEIVMTPACILIPDSDYITPMAIGANKFRIKFRLTFAVKMTSNQAALNALEDLIFEAYNSLAVGYILGEVSDPRPVNLGQSDLLAAEMRVEVITQIN